jgi:hypothetical protein
MKFNQGQKNMVSSSPTTFPENTYAIDEMFTRLAFPVLVFMLLGAFALTVKFQIIDGIIIFIFSVLASALLAGFFVLKNIVYKATFSEESKNIVLYMVTGRKEIRLNIGEIINVREGLWVTLYLKNKKIKLNKYKFNTFIETTSKNI